MEILIIFLSLVGIVIYISFREPDKPKKDHGHRPPVNKSPKTYPRPPVNKNPKTYSRPYNSQTAKPVSEKRILKGAAYVIDGDSLVIKKTQVRLFGIDAPELNHPYGKKAKWALLSLCKGQIVHAEIVAQDSHGRTVAKCTLEDGRDLSAEMTKLGLAIDWPKFSGGVYRSLEVPDARKKMWLADARQKGRMHVWTQYETKQKARKSSS